jgi:excisionase family DNA binding protein
MGVSQRDNSEGITGRCVQYMITSASMEPKIHTTAEAAEAIGVSRQTLYSWIEGGKVAAPKQIATGQKSIRLWTKGDIERVKRFKGTLKRGPRSKKKKA